ncbi:MAG: histidinol-phosphatase [Oscillospiraceae bacterium]|nr:histidinol-phosphatase [Oscillospiraceae bacterium]
MLGLLYDMHCHILPGIDDGSPDVETSLEMLKMQAESGVGEIVCTPHFYLSEQSPGEFLEKRQEAVEALQEAMGKDSPKLYMGAEVLYTPSLGEHDLKPLCIEGTRYLLIELPYTRLTGDFIRGFNSFANDISREIKLILAHAERYLSFTDEQSLYEIMDRDMLIQLNCGSFRSFSKTGRFIKELIKNKRAHFLGTDCHNMTGRPPNMAAARKYIEKKFSPEVFGYFMRNAGEILKGKEIN